MGIAYVEKGRVETFGGMPDELTTTWKQTKGQDAQWNKVYWSLQKNGWSQKKIEEAAALPDGKAVHDVMTALQQVVMPNDACAIANWLGGLGATNMQVQPWLITKLLAFQWWLAQDIYEKATNTFLNPSGLVAEMCNTPINVGDALLRLRKVAPAVHWWVVQKGFAKALRKHSNLSADVTQVSDKAVTHAVHALEQGAKKTMEALGDAAEGVGAGLSLAAFLAKNWMWIAGALALGWVYVEYRKIEREP